MTDQAFDRVGDQFVSYYDTVRGHVREQLTRENLSPFVMDQTLEVLDVGGGDGRDAVWLANQGHKVRLIDTSSVMLEKAERTVNDTNLGHLVTIEQLDPDNTHEEDQSLYDLVLSHGVLMYVDDPQPHLSLLRKSVKAGGIVSILTKGRPGSLLRLLYKGDIKKADELRRTGHLINNLGERVLAVDEASITPMLRAAQLSIFQAFGVRIATDLDYRPFRDLDDNELKSILEIESELGAGDKTKEMGQMLHFICKPQGEK